MIEVIYKEEKKEPKGNEGVFRLPKNIRQIGLLSEHYKIYMEDYVSTFLKKTEDEAMEEARCALLLGQNNFAEGIAYVFIRCALLVEERVTLEHLEFSSETWQKLQEQMEQFFPEQEIVGWVFVSPGISMNVEDSLYRAHVTHFGGDKVLFLMESQEKEEAFFRYENNHMIKQPGYYIYYERNPMMQAYMQAQNENHPMESKEDVDDTAVKNFRKIIMDKKENKENTQSKGKELNWVPYAASVCLAISVFAVGANFLGSYEKMKEVPEQIREVSLQLDSQKITQVPENNSGITVTPSPLVTPTAVPTATPAEPIPQETPVQESGTEETSSQPKKLYQIKEGDTLNNICMRIYGTLDKVTELCEKNNLSEEETIYPGQIIVLP